MRQRRNGFSRAFSRLRLSTFGRITRWVSSCSTTVMPATRCRISSSSPSTNPPMPTPSITRRSAGSSRGMLPALSLSYEQALRLNPHLRSAAYGAFQARQRLAGRTRSACSICFASLKRTRRARPSSSSTPGWGRWPRRWPSTNRRGRAHRDPPGRSSRPPHRCCLARSCRLVETGRTRRSRRR